MSVLTGAQVTITLNLVNKGPAAANNVTLADSLPAGGTLASATASQGSCSPPSDGQIGCGIGTLAPSATATVTIPVTFTGVGEWTNTVNLSATEPDPDTSNNQPNLNFDVAQAPDFVVAAASPSLTPLWSLSTGPGLKDCFMPHCCRCRALRSSVSASRREEAESEKP